MALLGVNIDHVATVRQARRTSEPDPVWAAAEAQLGGADGITIHLREDRRHIQDRDGHVLRQTVTVPLNLEMACADEIVAIACQVRPEKACLVPEKREEVTTEGGLDVVGQKSKVADAVRRLREAGIQVSLFIDAEPPQIEAARDVGADAVELHTGRYAEARGAEAVARELAALSEGVRLGGKLDLIVNAGHGLTYGNVRPVAAIEGIHEFNIGHSIVSRAIFVGLRAAVAEMKRLVS
jgi:pyridoxine 5-phosphate synthase